MTRTNQDHLHSHSHTADQESTESEPELGTTVNRRTVLHGTGLAALTVLTGGAAAGTSPVNPVSDATAQHSNSLPDGQFDMHVVPDATTVIGETPVPLPENVTTGVDPFTSGSTPRLSDYLHIDWDTYHRRSDSYPDVYVFYADGYEDDAVFIADEIMSYAQENVHEVFPDAVMPAEHDVQYYMVPKTEFERAPASHTTRNAVVDGSMQTIITSIPPSDHDIGSDALFSSKGQRNLLYQGSVTDRYAASALHWLRASTYGSVALGETVFWQSQGLPMYLSASYSTFAAPSEELRDYQTGNYQNAITGILASDAFSLETLSRDRRGATQVAALVYHFITSEHGFERALDVYMKRAGSHEVVIGEAFSNDEYASVGEFEDAFLSWLTAEYQHLVSAPQETPTATPTTTPTATPSSSATPTSTQQPTSSSNDSGSLLPIALLAALMSIGGAIGYKISGASDDADVDADEE